MNQSTPKIGNHRYKILALLFYAMTINYFDRSVIGVMEPALSKLFKWSNSDYASITMAFKFSYGIGMLVMGGFIDRLGTKKGFTLSIGIWSVFGMFHAMIQPAWSVKGFIAARLGLGIGEAGGFPAAIKTVAEWFPKKERAFATGIFNAATSVGAILAIIVVTNIVNKEGHNWQIPFLITGVVSTIWVVLWLKYYKKPEDSKKLSKEELEYIKSDQVEEKLEKVPWIKVLPKRQTWAFATAKLTDAVWWFYLFWGAKFINETFELNLLKDLAWPLIIIYLLADGGSILGGYLSGALMKKGWSINKARKTTLLICAVSILPVCYVAFVGNMWVAVLLIGLGAAGHQAWSANIFTLVSDVFPKKATASVVGIGGMVGTLVAIYFDYKLGEVLDSAGNHGYFWAFLIAGSSYLIVLGLVQLIMPKMNPLDDNLNEIKE